MNKNVKAILGMTFAALMLASCGGNNPSGDSQGQSTGPSASSGAGTSSGKYPDYKRLEDFDRGGMTFVDAEGVETPLTRRILENNAGTPCLAPLGEQRILVVPVGLDDDTGSSPAYPGISRSGRTEMQTQERLQMIRNLFFGEASDTGWQSVKSYYETSSFGKCTITGDLMLQNGGWWKPGKKPSQYNSQQALKDIRTFYTTEYAKDNHGALGAEAKPWKWYDQDGDGFVDTIWMVYSAAIHAYETDTTTNSYWAYVSRTNNSANKTVPQPMCHAWASIDFMDKAYGTGLDGHTFIHETGHIFGIDDYYSYDYNATPFGGIDMQDQNVGDQNAFSKWQYGWTSPYVVDDNAYIEMEPTTTSGVSVIIPSPNYNGTVYDEYFLIEFMSPVGLCEKDYKTGYEGTVGFTKPGLRISHVDARACRNALTDAPYEDANAVGRNAKRMRVLNTPSGRGVAQWRDTFDNEATGTSGSMYMINMFQAAGFDDKNNLLTQRISASNGDLFTKGFTFDLEPYYDTTTGTETNQWYTFMPSKSNLWNKAQDTTTRKIDYSCTFDYAVTVLDVSKTKVSFIIEKLVA